ncbi:hypothetical protein [Pedosphaera parvula]|uniref:DUF4878 domain-containing protein n=1 Tax=Pedosphaera parvula (strain Ellin514) TaxID=320771 RepID=B9XF81_PEDPL|nr:hypothetical protein [Pedosphaera parvula]EEF61579.1 hypothetical protein Cflav_PD4258 [Pedosphaera parvula Ellin514]
MRTSLKILVFLGLVAGMVMGYNQWKTITRLRGENNDLKRKIEEVKATAESNFDRKLVDLDKDVDLLRTQVKELPRLRNELQQLRRSTNELAKLRLENQQLNARQRESVALPSTPVFSQGVLMSKENWVFAGYATPESALQSAVWAMSKGDPKTFIASLSPEMQTEMKKEWDQKPESQIAAEGKEGMQKITGYRIQSTKTISADEVILSMHLEGEDKVEDLTMKRLGSEWKLAGPVK